MHHNWLNDNLLVNLFSYSPRIGREPLEDYCTEALAWCLRNHDVFRNAFLNLIEHPITQGKTLINTQVRFQSNTDRDDDSSEENDRVESGEIVSQAGIFDLLIENSKGEPAISVIECKRADPVLPKQVEKYRWELDGRNEWKDIPKGRKRLVTLSNSRTATKGSNKDIRWTEVHNLLKEIVEPLLKTQPVSLAAIMCLKFANFLENRGLNGLEIMKIESGNISHWMNGMRFRKDAERILTEIKKSHGFKFRFIRQKVVFEENEYGIWLGLYDNGTENFYLGFRLFILPESTLGEISLYVERSVSGNWGTGQPQLPSVLSTQMESGKNCEISCGYEKEDNRTVFIFEKVIDDGLDGDAEKIRDWFIETSELADKLDQLANF